jgi:hypothetical protein
MIDYSTFSEVSGIVAKWLDNQWDFIYPIATSQVTARGTWNDPVLKSAAEISALACYVKQREAARLQVAGQARQSIEVKDEYKESYFKPGESMEGLYDPCSQMRALINLDLNLGIEFQGGFEMATMDREADPVMLRKCGAWPCSCGNCDTAGILDMSRVSS